MDYQDAVNHYTTKGCHIFAMASVRKHGGSYLIVEDTEETWWTFDDDSEQNAIVHVYAVHDTPEGLVARDIRGDRPLTQVLDDVKEFFGTYAPSYGGDVSCQQELMDLIEGPHERCTDMDPPLLEFTEKDLADARKWVDWLPFIDTSSYATPSALEDAPEAEEAPVPMMMR